MCLNKNSFDLLLISFVFYIRYSLERQTKNSGVLLNCHGHSYSKFLINYIKDEDLHKKRLKYNLLRIYYINDHEMSEKVLIHIHMKRLTIL